MVNEWTRDDLPSVEDANRAMWGAPGRVVAGGVYGLLDAVVDHLNENYPKADIAPSGMSHNTALSGIERAVEAHLTGQSVTIDELQKRAEQAERERDDLRRQVDDLRERRRRHSAEREAWTRNRRDLTAERDAAVARAESRPTVTREEVAGVITRWIDQDGRYMGLLAAVCDLFGIEPDPYPVLVRAAEYAAAVGIDWDQAEPEDVDLLMKVAAHVLGQEDPNADQ